MNYSTSNKAIEYLLSKNISYNELAFSVIVGSGLSTALEKYAQIIDKYDYREIPTMPKSGVHGHCGELLIAKFTNNNNKALIFSGRIHLYEGYNIGDVLFQVRLSNALKINKIIITCAAGSLDRSIPPGTLGLMTDQIDFQCTNTNNSIKLPNQVYNKTLINIAYKRALEAGIPIRKGILGTVLGPTYETPAEARMAKIGGADWLSMSTSKESYEAAKIGLEVLGIAGITNYVNQSDISHDLIIKSAEAASNSMWELISLISSEV